MNLFRRLGSNVLALLSIVAVLAIVFSVLVGGLSYYQQGQDRIEAHSHIEREAKAIGTYVVEAVLRNDYQNILSFIGSWGQDHGNVAGISIRVPNGFEIASYRGSEPAGIPATERYVAFHKDREIATVELTYDIANLLDERHRTRLELVPYIVAFTAILALILWVALMRLVLLPMQRTDTQLNITAKELAGRNLELRQALRHAEVANKAKTSLMSNMSHELRTPLNAIIGFSETMKDSIFGPMGNEQYEEYAEHIHSSGTHLLQLINDILDVSAIEEGKLELREGEINIVDTCEAAIRMIAPRARESDIALNGINKQDLPLLMADPLRLKQVFINLISNAVKFTPEHGSVLCDAFTNDGGDMVITITDTGMGMDDEGIEKAMIKFGQVDGSLSRTHEGTGLGLPLTKGLVEMHGGTLKITSELGEGTKVTVRFPSERVIYIGA